MKKTLVALAALASMSAFAQSSVTLYGVADFWVGTAKGGAFDGTAVQNANPISQTRVDTGGLSGSRWGLRGTEDLGGGLAANFVFESGFNLDQGTSAQGGRLFGRQAFAGLSGGFGNFRAGRQYTAYDELRGATDTMGHTSFSTTVAGGSWSRVGVAYAARVNNSLRYETPNMGGFSGAVTLALGENKTAATSAGQSTAFHAKYANGPLLVGMAFQNDKGSFATVDTLAASPFLANDKVRNTLFGGSYDLGVAKISASFNSSKATGAAAASFIGAGNSLKETGMQFGATVPMGAVTLAASYSQEKSKANGVADEKGRGYGLQVIYALSKRTNAYFGMSSSRVKDQTVVGTPTSDKVSVTAFGLRHTF